MSTRWAYVNCEDDEGHKPVGPIGSLQFVTGTNATSGSKNLIYTTGSGGLPFSTLTLTGTLRIKGAVSASSFHVKQTDTISGSTLFGNDLGDYHIRTGSLYVGIKPSLPTFQVKPALSQSQTKALRVQFTNVASARHTAAIDTYVLGVSQTGVVNIRLPTASAVGAGALIVIKDQVANRSGNPIYVSASKAAGEKIDNANYYTLNGTMPAISLYSNGSHWFVF